MTPTTSKPYELRAWPFVHGFDVFRVVGNGEGMMKIGMIHTHAEDETYSARFEYQDDDGKARIALLGSTYPTLRAAFDDLIWTASVVWTAPGADERTLAAALIDHD